MFQLTFDIPGNPDKIALNSKIYLAGSCFTENIGQKLQEYKFNALINPFGNIYNPISIFENLGKVLQPSQQKEEILLHREIYHTWNIHGRLASTDLNNLKSNLLLAQSQTRNFLESGDWLVFSLGTAWVYELISNQKIVANCHKYPANHFKKRLLSVEEMLTAFFQCHQEIKKINPRLKYLFTISPVRHLKDGWVENTRSKALLVQFVHEVVGRTEGACYFPSYEIVMDEMRDYRYYKDDFIHPSQLAVDYIWDRFITTYFDEGALEFVTDWKKILAALRHKPFHPGTQDHQAFVTSTLSKLDRWADKVDVSEEVEFLKEQYQ